MPRCDDASMGFDTCDCLGVPFTEVPPGGGTVVIDELTLAVAGVGGDLMGDWALQRLAQFGVDTSGVQRRPGCKMSSSIVTTRADGARPALHLKGATSALIATGLGTQAGVRDCAHTLDVMTTTRTRA